MVDVDYAVNRMGVDHAVNRTSSSSSSFRGGLIFKARRIWNVSNIRTSLGEVPREQKILKGHLSRVICHQVY